MKRIGHNYDPTNHRIDLTDLLGQLDAERLHELAIAPRSTPLDYGRNHQVGFFGSTDPSGYVAFHPTTALLDYNQITFLLRGMGWSEERIARARIRAADKEALVGPCVYGLILKTPGSLRSAARLEMGAITNLLKTVWTNDSLEAQLYGGSWLIDRVPPPPPRPWPRLRAFTQRRKAALRRCQRAYRVLRGKEDEREF